MNKSGQALSLRRRRRDRVAVAEEERRRGHEDRQVRAARGKRDVDGPLARRERDLGARLKDARAKRLADLFEKYCPREAGTRADAVAREAASRPRLRRRISQSCSNASTGRMRSLAVAREWRDNCAA